MCRWLAYTGAPIKLSQVLYTNEHSLIDQSLHSKLGAEATNGDGFGVGWYDSSETPGLFRSTEPAWNDANLHELSQHMTSPLFFAHLRAAMVRPFSSRTAIRSETAAGSGCTTVSSTGSRKSNDRWCSPSIRRITRRSPQTDTETMFYLALTFGLKDDPPEAVARMIGLVESLGRQAGVEFPFQGTIVTTDGESIWAFRYSSQGSSRSLFLHPSRPDAQRTVSRPADPARGLG